MTEHIATPLVTRRLITKHEELRRKREGTWDPTTMVSQTSPEGAALRAHRASPDKVTDAQLIGIKLLKNEAPPKFKAACEFTTEKPQGDGEDRTGLVEVPAGAHSPPHEPTSLPTSKAEPLPPGKEATSEAEKLKTETTPPAAIGGKPGRSGGGRPTKEKPPVGIPKSTPKRSPKRMRLILNALTEYPVLSEAADKVGIHPKTLAYWIRRSAAGDDGYDIKWQGVTQRFHEHYKSAICEAEIKLRDMMFERALLGYDKVLTRRGRVMYKMDQDLVSQGYQGPDAYLKDENGNPIPETIRKVDMKAMLFILEWYRPNTWGKHPKIDVLREGGVLVIGDVTKKPKYNTAASVRTRRWKAGSRMIREDK